jgi:hypothetical protein
LVNIEFTINPFRTNILSVLEISGIQGLVNLSAGLRSTSACSEISSPPLETRRSPRELWREFNVTYGVVELEIGLSHPVLFAVGDRAEADHPPF